MIPVRPTPPSPMVPPPLPVVWCGGGFLAPPVVRWGPGVGLLVALWHGVGSGFLVVVSPLRLLVCFGCLVYSSL